MIRLGTLIWLVVLAFMGIGVFQLKYSVQAQEKELRQLRRQMAEHLEAIHVMEAEWSYLNDPVRLADLTRRHTDLVPITANQIAGIDRLTLRAQDEPARDPSLASSTPAKLLPLLPLRRQVSYATGDTMLVRKLLARLGG